MTRARRASRRVDQYQMVGTVETAFLRRRYALRNRSRAGRCVSASFADDPLLEAGGDDGQGFNDLRGSSDDCGVQAKFSVLAWPGPALSRSDAACQSQSGICATQWIFPLLHEPQLARKRCRAKPTSC